MFRQKTAPPGAADSTLPTFGGVTSVTSNSDGSFTVAWSAGSTTKTPLEYHIYIGLGALPAATLFSGTTYKATIAPGTQTSRRVFLLADGSTYFVNGQQYTFGVRAVDAFGFMDSNVAVINSTAIGSGNLPAVLQSIATQFASTQSAFAVTQAALALDASSIASSATSLASSATSIGSSATSLASSATSLSASASSISASASSLSTNVSTLTGHLTTLNGYLTTLGADIATLTADIATLGGHVTTLGTDLTTLSGYLTTLSTDLTTLSGYLTAFDSSNTDFVNELGDLNTSIADLNASITSLNAAIAGAAGLGGLQMNVLPQPNLSMEIIDQDGNII